MSKSDQLVKKLANQGFTASFVQDCFPDWWDAEAEESPSSWLQLQLGLAERLSIDPLSLIDEDRPLQFSEGGTPKFKRLIAPIERVAHVTAFARGLTRMLISASDVQANIKGMNASELRDVLLKKADASWVGFPQVMHLCAALNIPVGHITAFPSRTKGMSAIVSSVNGKSAIFTVRRSLHHAQAAFFIAHELGHIALGHTEHDATIVDGGLLEQKNPGDAELDDEEVSADRFAMELLTGKPDFTVAGTRHRGSSNELAEVAYREGVRRRIDPAFLVLCYGRSMGRWSVATSALRKLQASEEQVASTELQTNAFLRTQIDVEMLSHDEKQYLDKVLAA